MSSKKIEEEAVQDLIDRISTPEAQKLIRDQIVSDYGKTEYYKLIGRRCAMIEGYMEESNKQYDEEKRNDIPDFQSFRKSYHQSIAARNYSERLFQMAVTELAIDTLK